MKNIKENALDVKKLIDSMSETEKEKLSCY